MQNQPVRQPVVNKDAGKKKSLFDDDDDLESNTFLKKPVKNEPVTIPQSSPQKPILKSQSPLNVNLPAQIAQKPPPPKKKGLFDDNDDEDEGFTAKKPVIPQKAPTPATMSQKKGLFDDNDDDDGFLKKKPAAQKAPLPAPATKKEQPKKRNLFDDSD